VSEVTAAVALSAEFSVAVLTVMLIDLFAYAVTVAAGSSCEPLTTSAQ